MKILTAMGGRAGGRADGAYRRYKRAHCTIASPEEYNVQRFSVLSQTREEACRTHVKSSAVSRPTRGGGQEGMSSAGRS